MTNSFRSWLFFVFAKTEEENVNASRMIETGRILERYEQRQGDNAKVTLSRLAWFAMLTLSSIGVLSVLAYIANLVGGM